MSPIIDSDSKNDQDIVSSSGFFGNIQEISLKVVKTMPINLGGLATDKLYIDRT